MHFLQNLSLQIASVAFPKSICCFTNNWKILKCGIKYVLEVGASEEKTAKYQTQPYPDQNGQNYARIIAAWANYRCAKSARSYDHPKTLRCVWAAQAA